MQIMLKDEIEMPSHIPSSIYSLPIEAWSECLTFLSPYEIQICSSILCHNLSQESGQIAAWRVLERIPKQVEFFFQNDSEMDFNITRFPSEKWTKLYYLLYHIVCKTLCSGSINRTNSDYDAGHTVMRTKVIAMELLFGLKSSATVIKSLHSAELDNLPILDELMEILKKGLNLCSDERITAISLRLAGAGHWSQASELISLILNKNNYTRNDTISTRKEKKINQKENRFRYEMLCFICQFLIDRLYSNTYVSDRKEDKDDMCAAVRYGREAVILASENLKESPSNPSSNLTHDPSKTNVFKEKTNEPPPDPKTSFSSDLIGLINAKLNLARALALLGQHVGLSQHFGLSLYMNLNATHDLQQEYHVNAESLFRECEETLDSALKYFQTEEELIRTHQNCWETIELKSKLFSARGEMYYCWFSPTGLQELLDKSICDFKTSIKIIHKKAMGSGNISERSIEAFYNSVPKSCIPTQMYNLKDLGKVLSYDNKEEQSEKVLKYALALSLRLHSSAHPSVQNILRLVGLRAKDIKLEGFCRSIEKEVNYWFQNTDFANYIF